MNKETITIDDFAKLDLRVGTVTACEAVEGSRKLLNVTVDIGSETRQILTGMAKWYNPEDFIGRQVVIIANLEPRVMAAGIPEINDGKGYESQGMILSADGENGPVLLTVINQVPAGSGIR